MAVKKKIPRGIRNNNPTNIRIGNTWLGEVQHPDETEFEQFCAMEYGIRAAFLILRRYIKRYKRNTVEKIISSWAPSNENNTQAYIEKVCKETGLDPAEEIHFEDEETMIKLVDAMCLVECGQRVPMAKIRLGYELA